MDQSVRQYPRPGHRPIVAQRFCRGRLRQHSWRSDRSRCLHTKRGRPNRGRPRAPRSESHNRAQRESPTEHLQAPGSAPRRAACGRSVSPRSPLRRRSAHRQAWTSGLRVPVQANLAFLQYDQSLPCLSHESEWVFADPHHLRYGRRLIVKISAVLLSLRGELRERDAVNPPHPARQVPLISEAGASGDFSQTAPPFANELDRALHP